jgi:hypothetical protein
MPFALTVMAYKCCPEFFWDDVMSPAYGGSDAYSWFGEFARLYFLVCADYAWHCGNRPYLDRFGWFLHGDIVGEIFPVFCDLTLFHFVEGLSDCLPSLHALNGEGDIGQYDLLVVDCHSKYTLEGDCWFGCCYVLFVSRDLLGCQVYSVRISGNVLARGNGGICL